MKASIVEMEGLLRGKCVPAKMLVNESLAEYLVRQFDALHERADKAERERDELRKTLHATQDGAIETINHAMQLQAELARRDAAAGECAGVVTGYAVNGYVVIGNKLSIGDHVYTAAPSAVLPPEMFMSDAVKGNVTSDFMDGANWMREQCLALGAQQQKVVELPELEKWRKPDEVRAQSAYRNIIVQLLDAAGVKWEVKK